MVTLSRRRAFTLIELLVVITVMAILMGLIVATIAVLRDKAKVLKTRSILATAATAMASSGVQARVLAPVEHPFAASAPTRAVFIRRTGGAAVATAGDAIRTTDVAYVAAADRTRVLFDDDVFADPIAPQFVGVPRWKMKVLGTTTKWVSRWLRISGPGQTGSPVEPVIGTWIDEGVMFQAVDDPTSDVWDSTVDRAMSSALGTAGDELLSMGAYWKPLPSRDPLIWQNRLRRDASPTAGSSGALWSPGTVLEAGQFVPYRIRGAAIVDAWGREILAALTPTGALRLESAGRDGSFRFDPGRDRILQTTAASGVLAGDDHDAVVDNVVLGPEE